jgi:hypothetical protein
MHRLSRWICLGLLLIAANASWAASGKIHKVLPLFLDLNGQFTISPSLYDRDAYQAVLRNQPELRSGLLYDVRWKSRGKATNPLVLRLELRGMAKGDLPRQITLEKKIKPSGWFGTWTGLRLEGAEFYDFGDVTAWRVTLWEGDTLLDSMESFLW